MNAYNSTIKIKPCKCGCGRMKKLGLNGYATKSCMPQEMQNLPKYSKGNVFKNKKASLNNLSKKVKSFAKGEDAFRDGGKSKSELLKLADKLFSEFVINRDSFTVTDVDTEDDIEVITCPCCKKTYSVDDKTTGGDKVVNALHFVDRSVYLLRYDEENVHAGCCYCNLKQHLDSKGQEYQNYREFLVDRYGEERVAEMEVAHRKINRIEAQMLNTVIELYS